MDRRSVEDGEGGLLERARRGDQRAFEQLVRAHQDEVYTLALRLLRNRELASDTTQEAFIRAWRALPQFRGESAFGTWLYRITVNTAWTTRRRWLRHVSVPLSEAHSLAEESRRGPEQAGETAELRGALRVAISGLPDAQRTVVVLKDVHGWSHADIAGTLGISVTAAKVRLHRARRALRDALWVEVEP